MNARRSTSAAVATALLAAVALASCSSDKKTAAPAQRGSSSGASTRSPSVAGGGASTSTLASSTEASSTGADAVDVCTLISAAKAAQLSGQPYTTATPESGNFGSECAYNNDDSTAQGVNLSIDKQNVDNTWQLVQGAGGAAVSGVGDKAIWDNDNTLYAVSGSVIIQVNGLDSEDKSVALAKAFLAALH